MFTQKCLLMFYNSFAKSRICYGLLIYGSAAKTNLSKIEKAQRRILRAKFSKKKFDSLHDLRTKEILTVFELLVLENIKDLFRQLRSKAPESSIVLDAIDVETCTTRWNIKKIDAGAIQSDCFKEEILRKFTSLSL